MQRECDEEADYSSRSMCSFSKTQLMRNKWCKGSAISLHGTELEETNAYVYLGRELRCDGSMRTELLRRKHSRSSFFDAHVLPALCTLQKHVLFPKPPSLSSGPLIGH
ncbi:hypothetical protein PRIPAC_83448 [Pristionchus pacificus]|uniref:Uncharacterized protein n=1 Tax=Pristionchus pacificus TaxID=54126 RepID=A0A2A6BV39_PRIPA|nr:hypothetical protein PRIPAC_83448 [Pristionchus pacificus]|eukprot:PDM69631.1 hypothetical protein PRIPAC_44727 [Pristionchus pacificus]